MQYEKLTTIEIKLIIPSPASASPDLLSMDNTAPTLPLATILGCSSQVTVLIPPSPATPSGMSPPYFQCFCFPLGSDLTSGTSLQTSLLPVSITPLTMVPTTQVCQKILSTVHIQYSVCMAIISTW